MAETSDDIRVSVYVITYNQERYIAQCLEGIVSQQTDFAFEAIVIDDCSTDNTPAIIIEYARRYPHIIRPVRPPYNRYSRGESKFLLDFLPIAKGKYIAICEGDDFWTHAGKLQRQADFLDSHPGYAAHAHRHSVLNETDLDPTGADYKCAQKEGLLDPIMLLAGNIHLNSLCVRREYIEADNVYINLMRNDHRIYPDTKLFAALARHRVWFLPETWSTYRMNNGGVYTSTVSGTLERYISLADTSLRNFFIINQAYGGTLGLYKNRLRCHYAMSVSARAHALHDIPKAIAYKLRAMAASPREFIRLYKQRYIKRNDAKPLSE